WTGVPGEIIDSSGNGLNGSRVNDDVISIRNGLINRAARFNDSSTDSIIEIPDPNNDLDNTDQLTIMGWINPATYDPINSNALGIYSKRNSPGSQNAYGMFMGFDGSGCSRDKLCIDIEGTSRRFSSNGSIPLNQWTHFALVYGAGEARLYINGNLDVTRTNLSSSIRASTAPLRLGDLHDNGSLKPFQGNLDEFKFFGGALSEDRVAEIYNNEVAGLDWEGNARPPVQCGLIFEARMEQDSWDGTPGEVLDTSGSEINGTAEGTTDTEVATPAIPGNPGTCRYGNFDGDSSGISFGSANLGLSEELTVMAWIRWGIEPGAGDGWANIATFNSQRDTGMFWLQHNQANSSFEFAVQTNNGRRFRQSSISPVQGEWQHVTGVYDGESIKIYINGVVDGQTSHSGTLRQNDNNALNIGRWEPTGRRFDGDIDEVRIFDTALDEAEIAQWRDSTAPCDIENQIDHIRLTHPQTALTCSPAEITVEACANDNCSDLYQGPTTVDFISPAATWIPDPVTFNEGSSQVSLQYTTADADVVLNAEAVDPAASNPTRCFTGAVETDCTMEFLDSGFLITLPDHISAVEVSGTIAAVKADPADPARCVPGFDNETKDIGFWSTYLDPASGTLPVGLDGNPLDQTSPGTQIPIAFDGQGVGSFTLAYPDVGEKGLSARYEGSGDEAGLIMLGETSFIARPSHFTLNIADNPAASGPGGDVFRAAGLDFPVEVSARNANDGVTPNFGRESTPETVSLSHSLVDPVGGDAGSLNGSFNAFGTACNGASAGGFACGDFNWSEVGIISLTPQLESGSYLGSGDVVGNDSGNVGRFIPDHFVLSGGTLINRAAVAGCTSDFTYIGERFDVEFSLTAQAVGGNTTMNYEGVYAFLDSGELNLSGDPGPVVTAESINWNMGLGSASAQLALAKSAPEGPFLDYTVTAAPVDDDGVALQSAPQDVDATDLFFGRMVVDSAIGSELGPLELPWKVERWENGTWWTHSSDSCTAIDLATQVTLRNDAGASVAGTESIAVAAGGGTTSIDLGNSATELVSGTGHFHFTAPLSPGWVDLILDLDMDWPFLRDDLNGDGNFDDNPSARASFGLFEGSPNRIFLREVMPR
ncbi:MAG: LamG domain-containing protein, partial [Wenzhouxiangella sp.]|nr:LamG domain-containing protein [Wenzhouxiangella sp.]